MHDMSEKERIAYTKFLRETGDERKARRLERVGTEPCYVYLLCLPDGTPFYVGKGSGRRAHHHISKALSGDESPKSMIIRGLFQAGERPRIEIVHSTTDADEAYFLERWLIWWYGRDNLANQADGGAGSPHNRKPDPSRSSQPRYTGLLSDMFRDSFATE